jgi:drug/metabolite transporter (DMT)-like permease
VPFADPRALAILVLTVLVWGYNWVPLKIAVAAIDPYWLAAIRVAGGALTLFLVLAALRRDAAPPPGRAFIGIGLAQVAGLALFSTVALHFGDVATVTALVFTMPLWTALFALPLLGERLPRARVAWLVVAAVGIAIVASGIRGTGDLIGGGLAMVAGAWWALGNVLQRKAAYEIDLMRLAAWLQLVAAVPLAAAALAFGHPLSLAHAGPGVGLAVLFATVVGSGLAWMWWGIALRALPANTVALASFAIPVIGTLGAVVQLHALPTTRNALGLAVVVAGLVGSVVSAELYSKRSARIGSSAAALRAGQ